MRWRGRRQSSNVDDLRGGSNSGTGRGGFRFPTGGGSRRGGIRIPMGKRGGLGSIGTIVVFLVAVFVFDVNPLTLLSGGDVTIGGSGPAPVQPSGNRSSSPNDDLGQFAATVLADTEATWSRIFKAAGEDYPEPRLVLFTNQVRSACGFASSASGPFYCPGDSQLYIDLAFFDELRSKFDAPGDFAQAYVIAHEVGHHVQNVMGILSRFHEMRGQLSEADYNALSVRIELQADCLAGVWGHSVAQERNYLERGDLEEGLNAAAQIGDDAIQKRTQGYVVPESFNHGASEQRTRWFRIGFEEGRMEACDTLNAKRL